MAINLNKLPPGVMIFDNEMVSAFLENISDGAAGVVFKVFIRFPWIDKESEDRQIESIKDYLISAYGEEEAYEAIPLYRFLVSGARRSLAKYRQRQEDGQHYANIRWDKEQTPEERPEV